MFQTSKSWFIFLVRRLKSGKFKQFSGVLYLFYKNPEYPQWLPYLKKKLSSSIIVLMIKLSNIATVLWQWKRELECESKKHCHNSVNNSFASTYILNEKFELQELSYRIAVARLTPEWMMTSSTSPRNNRFW